MIEILVLFKLGRMIAVRARRQGRSGTLYVLLLLGLWFGGEIGGAILGLGLSQILNPVNEPNLFWIYLGSLVCACAGAVVAFRMVKVKPPIQCLQSKPVTSFGGGGIPQGEMATNPGRPTGEAWAKIYPYIVPAPYVENQPTHLAGFIRPLGHQVFVMLVHDVGEVYRNVQPEELEAAGLSFSEAHALALDNLQKLAASGAMSQHLLFVDMAAVPTDFLDPGAPASARDRMPFVLWTGHPLAASCLLLPHLYSWAQKQLGSADILASIPQRETLLLFPKGDACFRGVLRRMIQQAENQAIKLISFERFSLRADTIEPFVEPQTSIKAGSETEVQELGPRALPRPDTDAADEGRYVLREKLIAHIAGPENRRPTFPLKYWLVGLVILLCAGVWIVGFALKKSPEPKPHERPLQILIPLPGEHQPGK